MNVNIPPDSEAWLMAGHPRGPDDGGLWSMRWPPPCEVGERLYFRFGGELVATAVCYAILEPGQLDNWAHHGKRYLAGHKVCWLWQTFEDLTHDPERVQRIERELKERARRRKDKGQGMLF